MMTSAGSDLRVLPLRRSELVFSSGHGPDLSPDAVNPPLPEQAHPRHDKDVLRLGVAELAPPDPADNVSLFDLAVSPEVSIPDAC